MFFITTTDGDELVMRADAVLGFKAREGQAMFPEEQRGFDDNGGCPDRRGTSVAVSSS